MTAKIEEGGGQAYPVQGGIYATRGVTKREFFAAHALPGILMSYDLTQAKPRTIARAAYALADEMILASKEYS